MSTITCRLGREQCDGWKKFSGACEHVIAASDFVGLRSEVLQKVSKYLNPSNLFANINFQLDLNFSRRLTVNRQFEAQLPASQGEKGGRRRGAPSTANKQDRRVNRVELQVVIF